MKLIEKLKTLFAIAVCICFSNVTAQFGDSCADPFVIPTAEFVLDTLDADVTSGSVFFEFTVPTDGYISFSACEVSPSLDDFVNVYLNDCSNLIATETRDVSCVRNSKWTSTVMAGEKYIFEWDVDNTGGSTSTEVRPAFFYNANYEGYDCPSAITISCLGDFETEFRRVNQWFHWEAPSSSTFQLGLAAGHQRDPLNTNAWIEIYKGASCEAKAFTATNDPEDEYAFEEFIFFNAVEGENYYFNFQELGNLDESIYGMMQIVEQGVNPTEYDHEILACESFDFDGETLTESGDYQAMLMSQVGCDSLVNLNLTIGTSDDLIIETAACGSFVFDGEEISMSGEYNSTFQNNAGCDSTVNLHLTVFNHDLTITKTDATLTVGEIKGAYQWYNCDTGAMVLNATSQSFEPQTSGEYKVAVEENNCIQESECVAVDIVTSTSLSLKEISIYPNPSNGYLKIDLSRIHRKIQVEILDVSGRIESSSSYANLSEIPVIVRGDSGIFFIKLEAENESHVFRVVKH